MTAGQLTLHDAILQREASEDQAARDDTTRLRVDQQAVDMARAARIEERKGKRLGASWVQCNNCGRMRRLNSPCGWCKGSRQKK